MRSWSGALFDDPGQFRVGDGVDDALLVGRFEVGEDFRRPLLRQQAEKHGHAVVLKRGEEFGHVEFRHFVETLAQLLHAPALEQFHQLVVAFVYQILVYDGLSDFFFVFQARVPLSRVFSV